MTRLERKLVKRFRWLLDDIREEVAMVRSLDAPGLEMYEADGLEFVAAQAEEELERILGQPDDGR